ncbi:MAG: cytochrome c oxidase subunit 4 [Acidimicrobiales bacterium]
MKIEGLFLIGVGVFFGAIGLIYWFIGYEDGGGMMLLGSCLLGLVPGSFYYYWHRRFLGYRYIYWGKLERTVGERPEDRSDATIADGAGIISSFPGSSIWPLCLGLGAFLLVMTFIFGVWFVPPAVSLIVIALVGVTAESRRGGNV